MCLCAAACAEKYEDIAGLMLPPQSEVFLDAWKRPENLVLNMPDIPMLRLLPVPGGDAAAKDAKGEQQQLQLVAGLGARARRW